MMAMMNRQIFIVAVALGFLGGFGAMAIAQSPADEMQAASVTR